MVNFYAEPFTGAKELLTNDGVIFIQIDDEQQSHLKVLCDEVFNEENYEITLYYKLDMEKKRCLRKMIIKN